MTPTPARISATAGDAEKSSHTPGQLLVERVAAAMFAVDWPKDDWARFKPEDHARQRYVSMAVAALDASAATAMLTVCEEFVRKVDAGEARSTRSYAQMKAAIAKARGGSQ